eukprot:6211319-Pleurochrysis_carterae.AAC.2
MLSSIYERPPRHFSLPSPACTDAAVFESVRPGCIVRAQSRTWRARRSWRCSGEVWREEVREGGRGRKKEGGSE